MEVAQFKDSTIEINGNPVFKNIMNNRIQYVDPPSQELGMTGLWSLEHLLNSELINSRDSTIAQ